MSITARSAHLAFGDVKINVSSELSHVRVPGSGRTYEVRDFLRRMGLRWELVSHEWHGTLPGDQGSRQFRELGPRPQSCPRSTRSRLRRRRLRPRGHPSGRRPYSAQFPQEWLQDSRGGPRGVPGRGLDQWPVRSLRFEGDSARIEADASQSCQDGRPWTSGQSGSDAVQLELTRIAMARSSKYGEAARPL